MFGQSSEKRMHLVRWLTTSGWLLLIFSLIYDPISQILTQPDNQWSPLAIDPTVCVLVQGKCLEEQPYPIGAMIFWGAVVPSAIFILLIFGHEMWRRICPLSFLSQIPRALGKQRQIKHVNQKTGKTRYELVKVNPSSWLGRNYLYLQFGLLYLGLCARILFINSDRLALTIWLLVTIVAAITVGYLYAGKSWCNYFCPMSPVQKIYSEPGGLFGSKAHIGDVQITQSMCRTVKEDGKEQSACVACINPCIDIDSERSYWDGITKPEQKVLYYGYFGLVVGYFCYYYLYAGSWDYYFSGAWAHQEDQLATLLNPGFYIFNTPIPIPKLIAVPLTLAAFSAGGYVLGKWVEKTYTANLHRRKKSLSKELIQHRIFTVGTFIIFNFFFIFGGRPLILLMPLGWQFLYEGILVGLSTLWLYHTWTRNPARYSRESLASRLRRQLSKMDLNLDKYIEGRSLEDLTTDEVYVLAKVLPGFSQAKRHEAYKGVLREALEEGYVNTSSSLEVLQQIREELSISEEEHRKVLQELGVEDPGLLDPNRQRSKENLVRLTGYRKSLERLMALKAIQTQDLLENETQALSALRQEYSLTSQEEMEILENLDPKTAQMRRAEFLLSQLRQLIDCHHALNQPQIHSEKPVLNLLCVFVKQKKKLILTGLLEIIEQIEDEASAINIATSLHKLAPLVLDEILSETIKQKKLAPEIISLLTQPSSEPLSCSLDVSRESIIGHLETLLAESNPVVQAASLYMLYKIDSIRAKDQSTSLLNLSDKPHPKVLEIAQTILNQSTEASLKAFSQLEIIVYLGNSDLFAGVNSETLIELAIRAKVKNYNVDEVITEAGDTCRELLLLLEGSVQIERHLPNGEIIKESLLPGYVLDELEVLSHTELANTIVALANNTRLLAIEVDTLDDLLARDRDFARRVLEIESRRLQQIIGAYVNP